MTMSPPIGVIHVPGATAAQALGRTLVLAPHPDDETLGCGGLLALLTQAGVPVKVVLVSDGTASHPHSQSHPPALMRMLRRQEMAAALCELGCSVDQLTALDLPDGAVPMLDREGYGAAFDILAAVAEAFRPDSVVLPWRGDAHPDHRASHGLGMAVCRQVAPLARRLEYVIWPPQIEGAMPDMGDALADIWHIDITAVMGCKRRALAQHRSQLGQVVLDDAEGFTLPASLIQVSARRVETYYCFTTEDFHEPNVRTSDAAVELLR